MTSTRTLICYPNDPNTTDDLKYVLVPNVQNHGVFESEPTNPHAIHTLTFDNKVATQLQ